MLKISTGVIMDVSLDVMPGILFIPDLLTHSAHRKNTFSQFQQAGDVPELLNHVIYVPIAFIKGSGNDFLNHKMTAHPVSVYGVCPFSCFKGFFHWAAYFLHMPARLIQTVGHFETGPAGDIFIGGSEM